MEMFLAPAPSPASSRAAAGTPITSSCPKPREALLSTAAEKSDKCHRSLCLELGRELGREAQPGEWEWRQFAMHRISVFLLGSGTPFPPLQAASCHPEQHSHSWGGANTFPRWVPASQPC